MAWPKGKPRAEGVGRKKGTPNRKTADLLAKCEAKGVDVFELMLEYAIHPCEPTLRFQALKELCQYIYPKRKAIEHDLTTGEAGFRIIVEDYGDKKK